MHTELEEDGVRISLTIVDTPGFGDNIDNEFTYVPLLCFQPLLTVYNKLVLVKLLDTSNANTMISLLKNLVSSETHASVTIVSTLYSTLSLLLDMRTFTMF